MPREPDRGRRGHDPTTVKLQVRAERDKKLAAAYREVGSTAEVARRFGVSRQMVVDAARKAEGTTLDGGHAYDVLTIAKLRWLERHPKTTTPDILEKLGWPVYRLTGLKVRGSSSQKPLPGRTTSGPGYPFVWSVTKNWRAIVSRRGGLSPERVAPFEPTSGGGRAGS